MAIDKKYIFGNWKMNLTVGEASLLVHRLEAAIEAHNDVEIALFPGVLALQPISLQLNRRKFKLGAQNFYWRDEGAYTGEISATQLRGLVKYALVGHSERRYIFGEQGRDIGRKMQSAIRNELCPVLCVGETASERSLDETADVIHDQLVAGLANMTSEDMERVIIAYEPVWAIGTGKNATPEDALRAVKIIRDQIKHLFGTTIAKNIPVLYGGSVSKDNAKSYLEKKDINGLLVGGASLKSVDFSEIARVAHGKNRE